jgi:XTP/dITP diphosphohydrolase
MRFMLASGNRHKLTEFQAILAPYRVMPMPLDIELPPEGLDSFAQNALGKAQALAERIVGDPVQVKLMEGMAPRGRRWQDELLFIGDDSGLEVEALGWAPGVSSARYAGVDGPGADEANVARLLRELAGFAGPLARRARFVCCLAAVSPELTHHMVVGRWEGAIDVAPRGVGGFGYDPVFVPDGSELTVAQWPQEQKDRASHRALAGAALLKLLQSEGVLAVASSD